MLLFGFRGRNLLFPGDAQYGNWKTWLEDRASTPCSTVSFLKVAHHGSHNATPRGPGGHADGRFAAMVSTQSKPWKSIPRRPS